MVCGEELGWQKKKTGLHVAQVADLVGADPKEIIFTSGATESNNMSIKGVANFYKDKKRHIITTQTERAGPLHLQWLFVVRLVSIRLTVVCAGLRWLSLINSWCWINGRLPVWSVCCCSWWRLLCVSLVL